MNFTAIIIAAVIVGGTGVILGLFLGVSDKAFYVPIDPKEEQIAEALPGNNCGGCGFPGCSSLATAIAKGEAPPNQCPVGGLLVARKVAKIMGQEVDESAVRKVALVRCGGTCTQTSDRYVYTGSMSCASLAKMQNTGDKSCTYGCLGLGDCVKVCEFKAIRIVDGISKVNEDLCRACGLCMKACPRHIIEMVPAGQASHVLCVNKTRGKEVMQACKVGCIGCKACEKVCEQGAITVIDNAAHIDYEKCTQCGACAAKCPRKIIR